MEPKAQFPYLPAVPNADSPAVCVPHGTGMFVTPDEPPPTRRYQPESRVYIRAHSRHRTTYGFGTMRSDIYPPI